MPLPCEGVPCPCWITLLPCEARCALAGIKSYVVVAYGFPHFPSTAQVLYLYLRTMILQQYSKLALSCCCGQGKGGLGGVQACRPEAFRCRATLAFLGLLGSQDPACFVTVSLLGFPFLSLLTKRESGDESGYILPAFKIFHLS